MGNDPNKNIGLHIKEEHKKQVLDDEKKEDFYKIYQQFSRVNGFLTKKDFNVLAKIENKKDEEQIFDIFTSKKDKMYFNELINLYTSFTNEKLKSVLLSFLLFGKTGKISKQNYLNNLEPFIDINDNFTLLKKPLFLENINYVEKPISLTYYKTSSWINGSKEKEIYYNKDFFIGCANVLIEKKKLNLSFFKGYKTSSQIANIPIKDTKEKTYICDCLVGSKNKNLNNEDDLEVMRANFNLEKSVTNGRLLFSNFEKLMKEIRVNQKLIDVVIKYLKNYTMKDYLNFDDFKNLMSNIYHPVSTLNKKQFLFKMILTIANAKSSIKMSELIKILQIENKDYNPSGTIDEKKFESLNDPIINVEIDIYIGYMDNLGLLPYLKFGVKIESQYLKKKIVNFILNERTAEEYLNDNFDNCQYFYPINIEFWNSLMEKGRTPEIEINNSLIAKEDDIYYIKRKDENNKKDETNKNDETNKKDETNKNQKQENQKENNKNKDNEKKEKELKEKEKENKNKIEEIKKQKKIGKLKKDKQYGIDYVIICDKLYENISKIFELDYEIKLEKIIKVIPEKKEEKKEEEKKGETPEAKETKETPMPPETTEAKDEKLEINIEKNYLRKKGNEKKGIKEYIVDFYTIKTIQLNFGNAISYIENEKRKIENKKEEEEWEKKTEEEKIKIIKE